MAYACDLYYVMNKDRQLSLITYLWTAGVRNMEILLKNGTHGTVHLGVEVDGATKALCGARNRKATVVYAGKYSESTCTKCRRVRSNEKG